MSDRANSNDAHLNDDHPGGDIDEGRELLAHITSGDRQALTALYLRYRLPLLRYLLSFTSDYGKAEELLQDTLVAVWKNAGSYTGEGHVRAWLFGIARRRAYKGLRRQELPSVDVAELESVPAADPEPEAALLARVRRDELAAALERLAAPQREVLQLIFIYELSYAEVTEVLGVPLGTVKSRLHAAKRALRACLSASEETTYEH